MVIKIKQHFFKINFVLCFSRQRSPIARIRRMDAAITLCRRAMNTKHRGVEEVAIASIGLLEEATIAIVGIRETANAITIVITAAAG